MNLQDMDDKLLAELIAKCEEAMARPFKKKKPEPKMEVEPEEQDAAEEEPKDEDEELDIEELMRAYESRK